MSISDTAKENLTPVYTLDNTTDKQIQEMTGFLSWFHIIAYIILICNGNLVTMTEKMCRLTWLEEWLLALTWMKKTDDIDELKKNFVCQGRILSMI